MATWRDRFAGTKASYKGVRFTVLEVDLLFGRELTRFDIAKAPEAEGLASLTGVELKSDSLFTDEFKLPKEFEILCSFSGDNYIEERDAFMEKISEGGFGDLVLQNHDPIVVQGGRGISRYSSKAGGYEEIRIQFAQYDDREQPTAVVDTFKAAQASIDEGRKSGLSAFATSLARGARSASVALAGLTAKVGEVVENTLGVGAIGDALEACTDIATQIQQAATTIIFFPEQLAGLVYDLMEALTFAFENPKDAVTAQFETLKLYANGLPEYQPETPTEVQIALNQIQMTQLVNNATIMQVGNALILSDFVSSDEANAFLRKFEAAARAQQLINGDTDGFADVYYQIANILSSVRSHVQNSQNLPSIVQYDYNVNQNAFSLAQDLYGNAERASDLVARNSTRNPLFMQNTLEALSF